MKNLIFIFFFYGICLWDILAAPNSKKWPGYASIYNLTHLPRSNFLWLGIFCRCAWSSTLSHLYLGGWGTVSSTFVEGLNRLGKD